MEVEARAVAGATERRNRRAIPRYDLDEAATILLVNHGSLVPGYILDLSLGGCRMRTNERFVAGILVRVEVMFKVRGIQFRFSGVTQWTNSRDLIGIRFVDVTSRRREELAEALEEVAEENAVRERKLAAERMAAEQESAAGLGTEAEATPAQAIVPESGAQAEREPTPALTPAVERSPQMARAFPVAARTSGPLGIEGKPAAMPPPKAGRRERRAQSRHGVDTSAVIYLIKIGSALAGRIVDLSLSGCRIRTNERFPVGIYTRVETEFRLEGLPFRLGGVIQAVHDRDRHNVGIRFLDMSSRKREQVEQLIEELEETRHPAGPGDSGEGAADAGGRPSPVSQRSSEVASASGDEVEDEDDYGHNQQEVNQPAGNVKAESQEPQN